MPTVLLLRHGRTTANTSGVLAGWTPGVGLDDTGREQAQRVGRRLAEAGVTIARIVTSPLERCRETAVLVAATAAPGIPVEVDERLAECRYGAWTGRSLKALTEESLWRVVQDQPSAARFPDGEGYPGESIAAMQARAVTAVREVDRAVLDAAGPAGVWLAVSHGDVIKSVLADAAGAHLDQFQRIQVDPASVSVVRYTERRPFLVRSNDTGGELASLAQPAEEPGPVDGGAGEGADGDGAVGGGPGAVG